MITLKNVTKTYNHGKSNQFVALKSIDLKIDTGEMTAITGKSGAGKSTLLHIIACIDTYEDGEYYIDEILVKKLNEKQLAQIRNSKIGIVMQDFALVDEFTAIENVLLPLNLSANKKRDRRKIAFEALKEVGMEGWADKSVTTLSGGQKQRVAIARAVVNEPSIILADEPTGALDTENSKEIMNLFSVLNKSGKTIIIVTHDSEVAHKCNKIIEISDGRVVKNE